VGPITERAKRVKLEEVDDEYIKTGWLPAEQEHGFVQLLTEGNSKGKSWTIQQVRMSCMSYVHRANTDVCIDLGLPRDRWEAVFHPRYTFTGERSSISAMFMITASVGVSLCVSLF